MGSKRRSPTPFRRKSTAFAWFFVCIAVLVVGAALFYQFVIMYDFESLTDGTEPVEEFIPPEGYQPLPYPQFSIMPADATPTPRPGPRTTPVPIDKYAMLNRRLLIPTTYDVVQAGLVEERASDPDDNSVLVLRGWGYLEEQDASGSKVYVVVSTKYGENHRFYLATPESGSSGLIHDASTGTNLDQADFSCNINIEKTYSDGEYRLGVVVINRSGNKEIRGYARLDPKYNFTVKNGKITAFEGDASIEALDDQLEDAP